MIGDLVLGLFPLGYWQPVKTGWIDICPVVSSWAVQAADDGAWTAQPTAASVWTNIPENTKKSIKCGER